MPRPLNRQRALNQLARDPGPTPGIEAAERRARIDAPFRQRTDRLELMWRAIADDFRVALIGSRSAAKAKQSDFALAGPSKGSAG